MTKIDKNNKSKKTRSKSVKARFVLSAHKPWWQQISRRLAAYLGLLLLVYFLAFVVFIDLNKSIVVTPCSHASKFISDKLTSIEIDGDKVPIIKLENETQDTFLASEALDKSTQAEQVVDGVWSHFGDAYSSTAHLDELRTDMYIDQNASAMIFPPKYNFKAKENCIDCLQGESLIRPTTRDALNNIEAMPRPLPKELEGKNILSATISNLDKKRVAAFVFKDGEEERVYVYFLQDNRYIPIINDKSEEVLMTQYKLGKGSVVAGGGDDSFLILYSGYEGMAYHYLKGSLHDISHFFKINMMRSSFPPYIYKLGKGIDAKWYIVSLDNNINRLFKLWQNGTDYIKGSMDLSKELSTRLKGETIKAYNFKDNGEVVFVLSDKGDKALVFEDNGFDNTQERSIVSKNLNYKDYLVYSAVIKRLSILLDLNKPGLYDGLLPNLVDVYLGDSLESLHKVEVGEDLSFKGDRRELFVKMIFHPKVSRDYSPWVDGINDLRFLVER